MDELKNMKYWLLPLSVFLMLIISFISVCVTHKFRTASFCIFLIVLFIISYVFANKKMAFEKVSSHMQAFMFYRRCKKEDIRRFEGKMSDSRSKKIKEIVSDFEFAKDLSDRELKKLYNHGFLVSDYLTNFIKKKKEKN